MSSFQTNLNCLVCFGSSPFCKNVFGQMVACLWGEGSYTVQGIRGRKCVCANDDECVILRVVNETTSLVTRSCLVIVGSLVKFL